MPPDLYYNILIFAVQSPLVYFYSIVEDRTVSQRQLISKVICEIKSAKACHLFILYLMKKINVLPCICCKGNTCIIEQSITMVPDEIQLNVNAGMKRLFLYFQKIYQVIV